MVNQQAMYKIEDLLRKYRYNWGREVDFTILPPGISQEKLVTILEYISETGDSVLVGWNKLSNLG